MLLQPVGDLTQELPRKLLPTRAKEAQSHELSEIKEIVSIKRAGRVPCPHVRALLRRKGDDLDQRLRDLTEVRDGFRALLNGWRSTRLGSAVRLPSHREDRFDEEEHSTTTKEEPRWRTSRCRYARCATSAPRSRSPATRSQATELHPRVHGYVNGEVGRIKGGRSCITSRSEKAGLVG